MPGAGTGAGGRAPAAEELQRWAGRLARLEAAAGQLQDRLGALERSAQDEVAAAVEASSAALQAKVSELVSTLVLGTDRVRRLEGAVAGLEGRLGEQEARAAADVRGARQTDALESRVASLAEMLRQHEEAAHREVRQMKAQLDAVDAAARSGLQGGDQVEWLREKVLSLDARLSSSEQHMKRQLDFSSDGLSRHAGEVEWVATIKQLDQVKQALAHSQSEWRRTQGHLHDSAATGAQVQELRAAVAQLQAQVERARGEGSGRQRLAKGVEERVAEVERGLQEKTDVVQTQSLTLKVSSLERALAATDKRAEGLDPALACVEQLVERVQETRAAMVALQEQVAQLGPGPAAAPATVASPAVAPTPPRATPQPGLGPPIRADAGAAPVRWAQDAAALEHEVRSVGERLRQLELAHDRTRVQVKALERGLEAKASAEELRHLRDEAAGLRGGVGGVPRPEASELAAAEMQELKVQTRALRQALQDKAGAEELQALQSALAAAQGRLAGLEQAQAAAAAVGGERVDSRALAQLSGDISSVQMKVTRLDHLLQVKADSKDLQQLSDTVSTMRTRMPSFDQSHQLEGIRRQISSIEHVAHEKAAAGHTGGGVAGIQLQCQLQQLAGSVSTLEGKVGSVEQALQDKAGAGPLMQLKRTMAEVEARVSAHDQALQDKADMGQVQQLRSLLSALQGQVASCEQDVREKAGPEQLQQLKGSVGTLRVQLANVEQAVLTKVGSEQVQPLKTGLATLEVRLGNLEQRAATCEAIGAAQQTVYRHRLAALPSIEDRMQSSLELVQVHQPGVPKARAPEPAA